MFIARSHPTAALWRAIGVTLCSRGIAVVVQYEASIRGTHEASLLAILVVVKSEPDLNSGEM